MPQYNRDVSAYQQTAMDAIYRFVNRILDQQPKPHVGVIRTYIRDERLEILLTDIPGDIVLSYADNNFILPALDTHIDMFTETHDAIDALVTALGATLNQTQKDNIQLHLDNMDDKIAILKRELIDENPINIQVGDTVILLPVSENTYYVQRVRSAI